MTKFDIEIVSDTICPWCYIGKQKLDQAVTAYKAQHPNSDDTFSTTWMPFYLNPAAPKTGKAHIKYYYQPLTVLGVNKQEYYRAKFGGDRATMMYERLSQIGNDVGIDFKYGGKTGNTRDSHRLIQLGKTKSPAVQTRVVEELFAAYFENEGDITSHDTLLSAAVKAGLDKNEAQEWLDSDQGGKAVDEEVEFAKKHQISGVPNFTIQGKYEVGGAQDPSVFLRLFEKIKLGEAARA